MLHRSLVAPLVATMLVAIVTFLGSSTYTQRYLRAIDRDVDQIAENASPSIEHLSRIRISVRELQVALIARVNAADVGSLPLPPHPQQLHTTIATDLERYFVEPPFPSEAALWGDMRRELASLLNESDAVDAALGRSELPAAHAALARSAVDIEDLDRLLLDAITINAVAAHALARRVALTRVEQQQVSVVTNGLSVLLCVFAMFLALGALRRYASTLRTAEANLDALISSSPDAMLLEHAGSVVDANDAALRLLGRAAKSEILGRKTAELLHVDAGAHTEGDALCPGSRIRTTMPSGDKMDIDVFGVTVTSADREVRALVLRDVTSRIALEARLMMSDRLAAVGTLAAGIAHEVNNPLVYMTHNLTFAREELRRLAASGADIKAADEALADASVGAERVAAIVADLGMLARGDQDEQVEIDVHAVLDASANIAALKLRGGARIEKLYGPVPALKGSSARLGQVMLNLLINAIHAVESASPAGEAVIRLRTGTGAEGDAVIEVQDNGKGIESSVLDRLFDPFFTTKPVGVGTGLGLSISHTIVTNWGGRIDVRSVVGEGTTFRIHLPAAVPSSRPCPTTEAINGPVLPRSGSTR